MANFLIDSTYHIMDTQVAALEWPSGGARINKVVIYSAGTNAAANFLIGAGTPILIHRILGSNSGFGLSQFPATQIYDFNGTRFQTAWIPSTLTACSAWIHFA